ncbi:hypothetical protein EDD18DRAFT_1361931 [Armillaria luteobubalina]|uniref:Uncharacterized protein n=1 Tax=Armillaria luteobubalina TaxID=153913 RepID=A0AA39PHZ1_9AGAR|nr:hypothetical protein EDD18DRAFT_1361931 [Armillaria luteobubalina]
MAVLHNPKPKVKRRHVGWNSHSIELYANMTDIAPAHRCHHHHSWSFAGSLTISSVKHGFVHLPVSPQKRKSTAAENITDLPELIPGSDNIDNENGFVPHAEYHLDPKAYALAMAGDVEDIATAPRWHIYTYNPLLTFSSIVALQLGVRTKIFPFAASPAEMEGSFVRPVSFHYMRHVRHMSFSPGMAIILIKSLFASLGCDIK